MPSPEYNEALSSQEEHLDLLKKRLETAGGEYRRAQERDMSPEAIEQAQQAWAEAKQECETFALDNGLVFDSEPLVEATEQESGE